MKEKKGEQLLNKINSSSIFGKDVPVISTNSFYYNETEEGKKESQIEPEIKLMTTEELFSNYEKEFVEENDNEDIFSELNKELESQTKNDLLENSEEDFFFESEELTDETFDDDIDEESKTDSDFLEEKKELDLERLKAICESKSYPFGYPKFEELVQLKKEHQEIFMILNGNLYEEFHFGIESKIFICTTFKSSDYLNYLDKFKTDKNIIVFYPFVASTCLLYPKMDFEDILDLPSGLLKKIVDNVLIKSDYKTSVEVIEL